MKKGRSTKNPTKDEQARMDAIKEGGCVIAYALGLGWIPCEVEHLTGANQHGQKRIGHMATVGLNVWSHRGIPLHEYGWDYDTCRAKLGPSYHHEARAFRELWPVERLLAVQDEVLGISVDARSQVR